MFLTQESNWGLLDCWWILYQLSYQGSPKGKIGPLEIPGMSSLLCELLLTRELLPSFFLLLLLSHFSRVRLCATP